MENNESKNYIVFDSKGENVNYPIIYDSSNNKISVKLPPEDAKSLNNMYKNLTELQKDNYILFIIENNSKYGAFNNFKEKKEDYAYKEDKYNIFLFKINEIAEKKEENKKNIEIFIDILLTIKKDLKNEIIKLLRNLEIKKPCEIVNSNTMDNVNSLIEQLLKQRNIFDLLERKKQLILEGPPGTGKSFLAKKIAENFADEYKIVQFHPSYQYEDFIRGIVSNVKNRNISYKVKNKILGEMIENAKKEKNKKYILIIDEINRANLPVVFGELIYALSQREKPVDSMYAIGNSREISLPNNLYIIGTMNTADRSAEKIDYAIRRRFKFIKILPDVDLIEDEKSRKLFQKVNQIIEDNISDGYDKDDYLIGHSYFMEDIDMEYEIKPLLKEYIKDGILKEDAKESIDNLSNESNNEKDKSQ